MPYALILPLHALNNDPLPRELGECAHAAFFHLLAQANAELAETLHASEDRKPFTLCPLFPNSSARDGAALRLTLLDEALFPLVLMALLTSREAAALRLGDAQFTITGALTTRQAHGLADAVSYAELRETPGREILRVRFSTPTVFRSQKRDVLWPEPRLVWQSWARTWQAHAPACAALPDEAQITAWAEAGIRVARHRAQTRTAYFGGGAQAGFVGDCEFDLRDLAPSERAALCVLAAFAFYAGTGRKTAMGLGQTG